MTAAQGVNYVERFIIDEGHTAQRMESDYGYDLVMTTFDADGYAEPGVVYIQVKAAETLRETSGVYVFDLDIRDYNLWRYEAMPVVLVLFDASRRRAYWLHIQEYFAAEKKRRPRSGAKTVRLRVSRRRAFNHRAVAAICSAKQAVLDRLARQSDHD